MENIVDHYVHERRVHKRYQVNWRGRILLPNKEMYEVNISDVSSGGVATTFLYALSAGTPLSIEFFVNYRRINERVRAKTRVAFNAVLSDSRGAKLGLQFTDISLPDIHVLNNVMRLMEEDGY